MPMLKMVNGAGTHIYPMLKSGSSVETTRADLCVFVPDGKLNGETADWVCSIEGEHGTVVIDTPQALYALMTALEIAKEKVMYGGWYKEAKP